MTELFILTLQNIFESTMFFSTCLQSTFQVQQLSSIAFKKIGTWVLSALAEHIHNTNNGQWVSGGGG